MKTVNYKDHFSGNANVYAAFRPHYPDALFSYLATLSKRQQRAWDCAAGNGQAALGLAKYFEEVKATDASETQITNAIPHDRIEYGVCTAEQSTVESASIDLVVVAQALHWFDFERFFAEVRRVTRCDGCIAVWCYGLHSVNPQIDASINCFYHELLGPYWPSERRWIETRYENIPFPFKRLRTPSFSMQVQWCLPDLLGYWETWSAVQAYKQAMRSNPMREIAGRLKEAWGEPDQFHTVSWPIYLVAGRV